MPTSCNPGRGCHARRPRPVVLAVALALSVLGTTGIAQAAEFGRARTLSGVGQPLRIEVPLERVGAGESAATLVVRAQGAQARDAGLADSQPLAVEGIVRQRSDGGWVVVLVSPEPVRLPVADLRLSLNSAAGSQQRRLILMLPAALHPAVSPISLARASGAASDGITVRSGDTAGRIAQRLRSQRGYDDATLYQVLAALLQANPAAFVDGNMNRLRVGARLTVPDAAAVRAMDPAEARRLYARHMADFAAYRARTARGAGAVAPVAATPEAGGAVGAGASAGMPPSGRDELRLSAVAAPAGGDNQARIDQLMDERAATQRALTDAQTRVGELESTLAAMRQLLERQNETLARLQNGAAGGAGAPGNAGAAATGGAAGGNGQAAAGTAGSGGMTAAGQAAPGAGGGAGNAGSGAAGSGGMTAGAGGGAGSAAGGNGSSGTIAGGGSPGGATGGSAAGGQGSAAAGGTQGSAAAGVAQGSAATTGTAPGSATVPGNPAGQGAGSAPGQGNGNAAGAGTGGSAGAGTGALAANGTGNAANPAGTGTGPSATGAAGAGADTSASAGPGGAAAVPGALSNTTGAADGARAADGSLRAATGAGAAAPGPATPAGSATPARAQAESATDAASSWLQRNVWPAGVLFLAFVVIVLALVFRRRRPTHGLASPTTAAPAGDTTGPRTEGPGPAASSTSASRTAASGTAAPDAAADAAGPVSAPADATGAAPTPGTAASSARRPPSDVS